MCVQSFEERTERALERIGTWERNHTKTKKKNSLSISVVLRSQEICKSIGANACWLEVAKNPIEWNLPKKFPVSVLREVFVVFVVVVVVVVVVLVCLLFCCFCCLC